MVRRLVPKLVWIGHYLYFWIWESIEVFYSFLILWHALLPNGLGAVSENFEMKRFNRLRARAK
jgi:hypothetical protein